MDHNSSLLDIGAGLGRCGNGNSYAFNYKIFDQGSVYLSAADGSTFTSRLVSYTVACIIACNVNPTRS